MSKQHSNSDDDIRDLIETINENVEQIDDLDDYHLKATIAILMFARSERKLDVGTLLDKLQTELSRRSQRSGR